MKKSYTPFKMWGAWVGFILGIVLAFLHMSFGTNFAFILLEEISIGITQGMFWNYFSFLLNGIFGFLLGWGIHALIRRLRK